MTFKLKLPCTGTDVENFIHAYCNHYGFTNCTVTSDGQSLIFTYDDFDAPHYAPNVPDSSGSGPKFVRC